MTNQTPTRAALLAARLRELSTAVTQGREAVAREFTMRIPAEPDRDADLVLSEAADLLAALAAPEAPASERKAEHVLAEGGVFKGHEGLRGLVEADAFWERQDYGTRLYYGEGGLDYLHRDVLRAAIKALDRMAAQSAPEAPAVQDSGAPAWSAQDAINAADGLASQLDRFLRRRANNFTLSEIDEALIAQAKSIASRLRFVWRDLPPSSLPAPEDAK